MSNPQVEEIREWAERQHDSHEDVGDDCSRHWNWDPTCTALVLLAEIDRKQGALNEIETALKEYLGTLSPTDRERVFAVAREPKP